MAIYSARNSCSQVSLEFMCTLLAHNGMHRRGEKSIAISSGSDRKQIRFWGGKSQFIITPKTLVAARNSANCSKVNEKFICAKIVSVIFSSCMQLSKWQRGFLEFFREILRNLLNFVLKFLYSQHDSEVLKNTDTNLFSTNKTSENIEKHWNSWQTSKDKSKHYNLRQKYVF